MTDEAKKQAWKKSCNYRTLTKCCANCKYSYEYEDCMDCLSYNCELLDDVMGNHDTTLTYDKYIFETTICDNWEWSGK